MTNEKDFHRVILRKVGVYFEARTDDLCILGTDREKLLALIDLWEYSKRSTTTIKGDVPPKAAADRRQKPRKTRKVKTK